MVLLSKEENISSFENGAELLKLISLKSKNPSSTVKQQSHKEKKEGSIVR